MAWYNRGGCNKIPDLAETDVTENLTNTERGTPNHGLYFFAVAKTAARAWRLSREPRCCYSDACRSSRGHHADPVGAGALIPAAAGAAAFIPHILGRE